MLKWLLSRGLEEVSGYLSLCPRAGCSGSELYSRKRLPLGKPTEINRLAVGVVSGAKIATNLIARADGWPSCQDAIKSH